MDNTIVSIVIPVFNNAVLVKIMVDSIVAQEYKDWELLLVDDGSDAQTRTLLQGYSETDSRIQLISRNRLPKGAQTCRNIGMKVAKGKYIVFFDSDDYVAPCCLSQRVAYMESHPELDFAVFPSKVFRGNDIKKGKLLSGIKPNYDDLFLFLVPRLPFIVWNNIYKHKTLQDKKVAWDEKVMSWQDSDFNIQCILSGLYYEYADSENIIADYYYRKTTSGSISKKIVNESHFKSHLYLYRKMIVTVREKYGSKYDRVLKNRSIDFFLLMKGAGKRSLYLSQLKKILKEEFRFSWLIRLQFKLYFVINKIFVDRFARYLSFPILIIYYIRYIRGCCKK